MAERPYTVRVIDIELPSGYADVSPEWEEQAVNNALRDAGIDPKYFRNAREAKMGLRKRVLRIYAGSAGD